MRKISKGEPHEGIENFDRQSDWTLSFEFHRLWREHILEHEQHGISGYTEEPLRIDGTHIDHFYKRSLFKDKVHSWENLIVDSIDETYGAKFKDRSVNSREDNLKLINPVTEDPRRFFRYNVDGKIVPLETLSETDRQRAEFTRDSFNLNEPSLVERRRTLMKIAHNIGDATLEQLLDWLKNFGFPSVVEQIYKER